MTTTTRQPATPAFSSLPNTGFNHASPSVKMASWERPTDRTPLYWVDYVGPLPDRLAKEFPLGVPSMTSTKWMPTILPMAETLSYAFWKANNIAFKQPIMRIVPPQFTLALIEVAVAVDVASKASFAIGHSVRLPTWTAMDLKGTLSTWALEGVALVRNDTMDDNDVETWPPYTKPTALWGDLGSIQPVPYGIAENIAYRVATHPAFKGLHDDTCIKITHAWDISNAEYRQLLDDEAFQAVTEKTSAYKREAERRKKVKLDKWRQESLKGMNQHLVKIFAAKPDLVPSIVFNLNVLHKELRVSSREITFAASTNFRDAPGKYVVNVTLPDMSKKSLRLSRGLVYHEICHILFTIHNEDTAFRDRALAYAYNILEDQRIEWLLTQMYPKTKLWLISLLYTTFGNRLKECAELMWGRRHYVPQKLWPPKPPEELARIIDEYMWTTDAELPRRMELVKEWVAYWQRLNPGKDLVEENDKNNPFAGEETSGTAFPETEEERKRKEEAAKAYKEWLKEQQAKAGEAQEAKEEWGIQEEEDDNGGGGDPPEKKSPIEEAMERAKQVLLDADRMERPDLYKEHDDNIGELYKGAVLTSTVQKWKEERARPIGEVIREQEEARQALQRREDNERVLKKEGITDFWLTPKAGVDKKKNENAIVNAGGRRSYLGTRASNYYTFYDANADIVLNPTKYGAKRLIYDGTFDLTESRVPTKVIVHGLEPAMCDTFLRQAALGLDYCNLHHALCPQPKLGPSGFEKERGAKPGTVGY